MRKLVLFLGTVLVIVLVHAASAQQFSTTIGPPKSGGAFGTTTGSASSMFSQSMALPNMSAAFTRPTMPAPLNLGNMLPSFPNLKDTMLLRNVFGGAKTTVQKLPPPKQAPPPPKKK